MKLKRILAGVAATAMAVSTMAVSAAAEEFDAFLMFTDSQWLWGNWDSQETAAADSSKTAYGTDAIVTGDGTYTVSLVADTTVDAFAAEAFGATVWCVDIDGLAAAVNGGKGADGYDDLSTGAEKMDFFTATGVTLSDVSIAVDGETVYTYDDADLTYGDIEGNGKLRLEIYNAYGAFTDAYPEGIVDLAGGDLVAYESVAVTFTVNGLDDALAGDATDEDTTDEDTTDEDTTTDDGADTGFAGLALAGLAVAGASVVATKKRK